MDHNEKREYLLRRLLSERREYREFDVPENEGEQKSLLRALMNVRAPRPLDEAFFAVQDEYLREAIAEKGVTRLEDLEPIGKDLYLWQGDITTLAADAIVNAANSGMTGCYRPNHACIDNCIHTYAGIRLRLECAQMMEKQGYEEPTGQAKITPAYNLPSKYVIHTVGPIVDGRLTKKHCELLASCYTACLTLAEENGCESLAFCCISTGVFGFPKREAATIAVDTVKAYKQKTGSGINVIFNVFSDEDFGIYKGILTE